MTTVERGSSHPLGPTITSAGTNFSLYSQHATSVDLLLYDSATSDAPGRVIPLGRTGEYWHAFVPGLAAGVLAADDGDAIVTLDTPSGPMDAHTRIRNGRVESVAIEMVPSFVFSTNREIEITGFGRVAVDLVCVGGFFAMVSARSIGIELVPENSHRLIPLGMAVIKAANRTFSVYHPERPEVNTVDVTEFYDEDPRTGTGIGIVIYSESHMDRSPCGTGTTALWHAPRAGHIRAIDVAESMSPVVLWIDEIEKGFSPTGGDQDGGLSKRIFGTFLTWLQEKKQEVFVVATANDIEALPAPIRPLAYLSPKWRLETKWHDWSLNP